MKKCIKCGLEKELSDYHAHPKAVDGHINACKACVRAKALENYYSNKGKEEFINKEADRKSYQRQWYQDNKEYRRTKAKQYREENAEAIRLSKKEYGIKNRKKLNEKRKEYLLNNPDQAKKVSIRKFEYKKSEKGKINAREWAKKRRRESPMQRLKESLRTRISSFIKVTPYQKSKNTQEMLGCDYEAARIHIESLFTKGMTWENMGRGGWHIDHIIPLSTAKTEEEMIKLCHYTNLQPLWEKENLSKGAKIICKKVPYTGFTVIQTIKIPVPPSGYCTPKSLTEFSKPQPTRQ